MLKPEKMAKVRVIGSNDYIEPVIEVLHGEGALQVQDVGKQEKYQGWDAGVPLERFGEASEQLVRLRGLEVFIQSKHMPLEAPAPKKLSFEEALEKAKKINDNPRLFAVEKSLGEAVEEEKRLGGLIARLKPLESFETDFSKLSGTSFDVFVGMLSPEKALKAEADVERVTSKFEMFRQDFEKKTCAVVAVDKRKSAEALKALSDNGFQRIEIPQDMQKPGQYLGRLRNELLNAMGRKSRLEKEAEIEARGAWKELLPVKESLEIASKRAEVASLFGKTKSLFVLEGWVKGKDVERIARLLNKASKGKSYVETVKTGEIPPTALANNKIVQNFEDIATFVSLPKSNEFDPSMIYAILFPIIYGLMLGDVGYGALVVLFGVIGYFKMSGLLKKICFILIPAGIWAIIFGLVFGEVLGFEFHSLVSRLEQITTLLLITIIAGAIHLAIGYIIGFIKEMEHGNRKHAAAKLAWLSLEIGGGLAAYGVAAGGGALFTYAGGFVVVAAIAVILATEGIYGAVELPGLLGNILSYSRMAAVGLASLALALVLNIFKPDLSQGPIAILFAVIWVAGHTLNFVLGIFEPFVQGSRLHYVEMFTKFFEGGGVLFTPFKLERKYTVE